MPRTTRARTAIVLLCVLAAAILIPVGARAASTRWADDSLWANALGSLGGVATPFDFAIFLEAAEEVRAGNSPYVDPDTVTAGGPAPYVYPPLLAIGLVPSTLLPDDVAGSSPASITFELVLIGCIVLTLLALGVRDWRCYPVALLYPPTLENLEYGAIGPVIALLVALGWRYRDRALASGAIIGSAVVLKVFVWPLTVWLAITRRWTATATAVVSTVVLALVSWAVIGFRGLTDYPALLRRLTDVEAEASYSGFALARAAGASEATARGLVAVAALGTLLLAWRAARSSADDRDTRDRRSLILALGAAFVLSPILWLHYYVLLVVPIALARPRLSALWFVPLGLTLFEALDWYRGWPDGDARALSSVALVSAFVFVASLRRRPANVS